MKRLNESPQIMKHNIGIIGAGNMGGAIYKKLVKEWPDRVSIYDNDAQKIKKLNAGKNFSWLNELARKVRIIILAVKPQSFEGLAEELKGLVSDKLIVSIMAGVRIKKISQSLKADKIVRAMPNLPVKAGAGMTAWVANKFVMEKEKKEINKIFSVLGTVLELKQEVKLDAVTAISGSGPAYFFYFSELLEQAAVKSGLTKQEAKILVEKTFTGSARLFAESGENFKQLKESIVSAKGTTAAALKIFEKNNLGKIITRAVMSAMLRAAELNQIRR